MSTSTALRSVASEGGVLPIDETSGWATPTFSTSIISARGLGRQRLSATVVVGTIVGLTLAAPTSRASAYRTLADLEGTPEPIIWETVPNVALDTASVPESLRESIAVELEHAAQAWNGVSCAGPLLTIDHAHVAPEVWIRYEPEWTAAGFDEAAAASTDAVLQTAPEGGVRLVGATIHLNGRMQWVPYGEARRSDMRDLRVVLVHELGHALGLAHVCEPADPALPCADEHVGIVMHPIYEQGGGARLATDDVEGICALYAGRTTEPAPCVQAAECYEGETCIDGECHLDNLFGAACAERSDCLTTYCIAEPSSPAGGICTRECSTNADCPSGTHCVPVEGATLHVCAPRAAGTGCSVGHPARRARGSDALFIALAALALVRRLRWRP